MAENCGDDIVGQGHAGSRGSDGASPYPNPYLPANGFPRRPVNVPDKLALIGLKP